MGKNNTWNVSAQVEEGWMQQRQKDQGLRMNKKEITVGQGRLLPTPLDNPSFQH